MNSFKRILKSGLAAGLIPFFVSNAKAAGLSFDGAYGGLSLSEYIQGAAIGQPRPKAAPAAAGARVYDFKTLYGGLGYPSPDYFGAGENEVADLETYISKEDANYREINDYLRFYPQPYDWYGIGPKDAKAMVKNIDRVFGRVPALPGDLVLFRGLDLKFHGDKGYEINEEFTDKGYVSTSASFKVARYFAIEINNNAVTSSRKAVFAIYFNPPGEKGILIDQDEDEVLLRHGMKFKVMAKKDNVKKYDLYLVQVCSGPCETLLRNDVRDFWSNLNIQD